MPEISPTICDVQIEARIHSQLPYAGGGSVREEARVMVETREAMSELDVWLMGTPASSWILFYTKIHRIRVYLLDLGSRRVWGITEVLYGVLTGFLCIPGRYSNMSMGYPSYG
jgi:hypothetical protein